MWYRDSKEVYYNELKKLLLKCDNESRIEFEQSDEGKFLWNKFDKAMKEYLKKNKLRNQIKKQFGVIKS